MNHPIAKTVNQCAVCHRIISWPVFEPNDFFVYDYRHCGKPSKLLCVESLREVSDENAAILCE